MCRHTKYQPKYFIYGNEDPHNSGLGESWEKFPIWSRAVSFGIQKGSLAGLASAGWAQSDGPCSPLDYIWHLCRIWIMEEELLAEPSFISVRGFLLHNIEPVRLGSIVDVNRWANPGISYFYFHIQFLLGFFDR